MAVSCSGATTLRNGDKHTSTSLLYHGWGIRGYQEVAIGFHDAAVHFRVEQTPGTVKRAGCGSREVTRAGVVPRQFRSLPIGGRPVWVPRVAGAAPERAVGPARRAGGGDRPRA
jgi:hypothetical protein